MRDWKEAFARGHYRWIGKNGRRDAGRILCYHNVSAAHASLFAAQLEFLLGCYDVLPLSEFLSSLGARLHSRRPALAITFDDGYRDNYEVAFPLLCRAGVSAAFCIVSGLLAPTAADRAAAAEPEPGGWSPRLFLTWEELREMVCRGMEVHLHSHRHQKTSRLSAQELAADLRASRETVTHYLDVEPLAYAVPFGRPRDCHPDLPSILRSRGIRYALLATHGYNDGSLSPYRLHRDSVQPWYSVDYLRAILHGCFDWTT